MNAIVGDYIRCILNLNQTETLWSLLPTSEIHKVPSGLAPRGSGNGELLGVTYLHRGS